MPLSPQTSSSRAGILPVGREAASPASKSGEHQFRFRVSKSGLNVAFNLRYRPIGDVCPRIFDLHDGSLMVQNIANAKGDPMSRLHNVLSAGNVQDCVEVLRDTGT